tara:strand:- start:760 stop:945 length:186 start_codon:yes stop_codon:yes gene_type:complete
MMEPLSIPAVTTLKSTDAIAIRQIVSSLIQAIEVLRKDVEMMKALVAQQQKPQIENYGARR